MPHAAAHALHEVADHGKSDATAMFAGAEERHEDVVLQAVRHAGAVVAHLDRQPAAALLSRFSSACSSWPPSAISVGVWGWRHACSVCASSSPSIPWVLPATLAALVATTALAALRHAHTAMNVRPMQALRD